MSKGAVNSTHSTIRLLIGYCEKTLLFLSGISLVIMTATILYSIFGRMFGLSVLWTNELAAYLIIYLTFFSAPWILQQDGHVQVDIFINKLNTKKTHIANMIISIIGVFGSVIIFWYSLNFTIESFQKGTLLMGPVQWSQYMLFIPIPVGSFFLALRFILKLSDNYLGLFHLGESKLDKDV